MRTHYAIIADAGGSTAFARAINAEPNTAKQWKRNDSIPAGYWTATADAGLASLQELAAAAEAKRVKDAA